METIWLWIKENYLWLLIILSSFYILLNIVMYFLQDIILFRPEKLSKDFAFQYENLEFEEYLIEVKPGVQLSGVRFIAKNPIGVIFYLKGNSRSIKGWGKFAVDFLRYNFDVIMIDYRGFGKSTGYRTQEAIKKDLQLVYDKIKEQVKEKRIILYGRSMGSGFATKLASANNPKLLILDAPYYSMTKTTKRYLPFLPISLIIKFPIPTYKWIKHVKCPIHIIHGTKDRLIPLHSSVELSALAPKNTRLHTVVGGGHNNMHNFEAYHEILNQIFLNQNHTIDIERSSINFKRKKGRV